jgi:hypothetical protein
MLFFSFFSARSAKRDPQNAKIRFSGVGADGVTRK